MNVYCLEPTFFFSSSLSTAFIMLAAVGDVPCIWSHRVHFDIYTHDQDGRSKARGQTNRPANVPE